MALVVGLFLFFIVLLMMASSSGQKAHMMRQGKKEYPPCKFQEEYLLACKYYQEYSRDGSRSDPKGDALYQARTDIWLQGFLPTALQSTGMSSFHDKPWGMRTESHQIYCVSREPSRDVLMRLRRDDESIAGLKGRCYYTKEFYDAPNPKWDAYIAKIEDMYKSICYSYRSNPSPFIYSHTSEIERIASQMTMAEFEEYYGHTDYARYKIRCKDYH